MSNGFTQIAPQTALICVNPLSICVICG
jgi:hypothetical protein